VEAPAALVVMLVVDAGDALITAGRAIYNQVELGAETRFALGASAVIGSERFHRAEARKWEWFKGYLMTMAAAGGAAFSGFELYEGLLTAGQRTAIKRGEEVAERLVREPDPLAAAQRLTDEERALLLEAILSAQSVLRRLGDDALEGAEAAAAKLASTLADPPPATRLPEWASHLDRATYEALGPLAGQPHVIVLFARFPREMAQYAADPLARDLLALPWRSFDDYADAVAKARNREGPQGAAFYEQIDPAGRSPPGIYFEQMDRYVNKVGEKVTAFAVVSARDDRLIARYVRRLGPDDTQDTGGLELTLDLIRNEPGVARELRWVKGLTHPLTSEGVPMTLYLNLRAMRELGLGYADPRLTVVKFSNMIGVESCTQLYWLRQTYPQLSWAELLRLTPHYRYTESFLEQAGYRIKGAAIDQEQWLHRARVEEYLDWVDPQTRNLEDFLSLHGLTRESEIDFGYDAYLLVEPR
jgi:hypothetical protein